MTRVEQAKAGIITDEIKFAAQKEGLDPEQLRQHVADGSIVIVRNNLRTVEPLTLGTKTRIKINANIGTSSSLSDIEEELEKMRVSVKHGADAIMDLSTAGDLAAIRKALIEQCPVAIGTVPLYEMAVIARQNEKSILDLSADDMFEVIENHCKQGVDFLTLHCGVTRQSVERFKEVKRLAGATSRGGTIIMEWIHHNKKENPLYEQYDRLLDICAQYDVAVSLGDGFRPGALYDATDRVQIEELIILGDLVKKARNKNVGVFVEGPGHVPLHQVKANIEIQKTLCNNAPFYVLGPLVTDISPGYDHITAAIGGAVAGMAGADFLCYVTPAEHLRLPSIDDVRDGVIASRIAAHAADISRGHPKAIKWDHEISRAKIDLNWDKMLSLCVDPDKAQAYRKSLPSNDEALCSMCGEFCAIKRSKSVQ
ncbi:phosphomethylpyrimidine synthase ThiC [Chitinispirillales bacterium ANBcel5]|uniref:phosphomethylpyrimidine synthase ThiC n=1 Tax=Cellulosispirillum alkaliphilum TaxID=3039283 RepID=UPI002A4F3F30|nr:phosphomethylpyrimidine synthase ThiC [Chitinispirillales bacterium ANBcel5]